MDGMQIYSVKLPFIVENQRLLLLARYPYRWMKYCSEHKEAIFRNTIRLLFLSMIVKNKIWIFLSWVLLFPQEHCSLLIWHVPLINREWGHYSDISDRGLDVLTERQEYNENTGSNFSHSLARAMALFVAHTKMFLYASFSFSYWKYSCTTSWPSFLLFSPTRSLLLLATQKSREKFHNERSLQENNAHSTANQSGRTIVAI